VNTLFKIEEKRLDWEKELKDIFSPVIVGLKDVTDRPRQMEILHSQILYFKQRIPEIKLGIEFIEKFMENVTDDQIRTRLENSKVYWKQQEKEFTAKLKTAEHRLFELEKGKMTLWEGMEYFFKCIVGARGKNILMAGMAFFITFLLFSLIRRIIMMINVLRFIPKLGFLANLIDVLLYLFTFVAATGAMIFTLYVANDWLILGIVLIILAGVVWAARNTLPLFVEQIKLLLSFGPVRQGERVIYNGIPYKVESIGIYSHLNNPLLTGGNVRLPLRDLIDMRSRPFKKNEPWFPCKEGDWVVINEETHRQVVQQTPQTVKTEWFGMREIMPTADFINQRIFNLSEAPYWTGITLRLAFQHRTLDPNETIDKLTRIVEEEMLKTSYRDHVGEPWVDFLGIGKRGIEFMVWVKIKETDGSRYAKARRDLGKAVLKAVNQNSWEIVRFRHIDRRMGDERDHPMFMPKPEIPEEESNKSKEPKPETSDN
jgi:hypothetical protein